MKTKEQKIEIAKAKIDRAIKAARAAIKALEAIEKMDGFKDGMDADGNYLPSMDALGAVVILTDARPF